MLCIRAAVVASVPVAAVILLLSQVSPVAPAVIIALTGEGVQPIGFLLAAVTAFFVIGVRWQGKGDNPCLWLTALVLAAVSAFLLYPLFPCVVPGLLVLSAPAFMQALVRPKAEDPAAWFVSARSGFLIPAVGSLAIWVYFIASRVGELEKWTDWTPEFQDAVRDKDVPWKVAFLEWCTPLGISVELFLLALIYEIQGRFENKDQAMTTDEMYIVSKVKLLGVLIVIAAMVLWIGATLDSTGDDDLGSPRADMRNEVLSVSFWVFAGLAAWLVSNLGGPEKVAKAAQNSKVAERVLEMMKSEWACACYLCCFAPFLLVYEILVKICPSRSPRSKAERGAPEPAAERPGDQEELSPSQRGEQDQRARILITAKFYGEKFMSYLWTTPVVTKAQILAMLYVSCAVGVKAITLMLAYTNALLASLDVYVVSLAIFAIGTFLFLLPPTPGPPVYALVGILVTASAVNAGWSTGAAMAWAISVGFAIKMVFAAVAQKFIGEPMATSPTIRNLVQMHTAEIRSIAMILQEEGITAAKVSILIGGPDWPVAVLCGMLKLKLCPIMLGLSPVLVQSVIPCVLSGSFLVLYSGDESKKALGESAMALAGALQMVALLLAGYFVQDTLERHYDELSVKRPEDKKALELEQAAAERDRKYQEQTTFRRLPCGIKFLLAFGLTCGIVSCIILAGPWKALIGRTAFKKFEVTSDIDKVTGGNVLSIILPLGWLSIAFCTVNAICLGAFYAWAQKFAEQEDGEAFQTSESRPLVE